MKMNDTQQCPSITLESRNFVFFRLFRGINIYTMCNNPETKKEDDSAKAKKPEQNIHPETLEFREYSSPACLLSEFSGDFDAAPYLRFLPEKSDDKTNHTNQ